MRKLCCQSRAAVFSLVSRREPSRCLCISNTKLCCGGPRVVFVKFFPGAGIRPRLDPKLLTWAKVWATQANFGKWQNSTKIGRGWPIVGRHRPALARGYPLFVKLWVGNFGEWAESGPNLAGRCVDISRLLRDVLRPCWRMAPLSPSSVGGDQVVGSLGSGPKSAGGGGGGSQFLLRASSWTNIGTTDAKVPHETYSGGSRASRLDFIVNSCRRRPRSRAPILEHHYERPTLRAMGRSRPNLA